jgi:hypothetical protein
MKLRRDGLYRPDSSEPRQANGFYVTRHGVGIVMAIGQGATAPNGAGSAYLNRCVSQEVVG